MKIRNLAPKFSIKTQQRRPRAQTKKQIFRQNKAGVKFHFVKISDDNESRELQFFIDFVEIKTKKGPYLKAMINRETIELQKFENLTGCRDAICIQDLD